MTVLVCGGRDYSDQTALVVALDALHAERTFTRLFHGGARGADRMAWEWAQQRGIPTSSFLADWKRLGRKAGPLRNQDMVNANPQLVVAFRGGTGTADLVARAKRAHIEVLEPTA